MPLNEVIYALSHGYNTVWQLADYFDVTERFAAMAVGIYNMGEPMAQAWH